MLEVSVNDIGRMGQNKTTRRGIVKSRHDKATTFLRTFRDIEMFKIASALNLPLPNSATVERRIKERLSETKNNYTHSGSVQRSKTDNADIRKRERRRALNLERNVKTRLHRMYA
jgi:hypothetical protein